jgi:DsbC/DsbD-like thiol-disulfide interchange protein
MAYASDGWTDTFESRARLVAAKERDYDGKSVWLAGVQLELSKGWKTYWRNPGDAGLPPGFDFSGSENLKSARVLWPAPERMADPAGISIGYHDGVVFPVLVEPLDRSRPVRLKVNFSFAVCKDICAPAEANLALPLDGSGAPGRTDDRLVSTFLSQVPVPLKPGLAGPSLATVDIVLTGPKPHITIDATFPEKTGRNDLFVEAPEGLFIPLAERVNDLPDGGVRYTVDLTKGDDPAELKGKTLTLTLVSPHGNREATRKVN